MERRLIRLLAALIALPAAALAAGTCPTATPGFARPETACIRGALHLVPNYETMSVELEGPGAGPALVRFRRVGEVDWRAGLDLWRDDRSWGMAGAVGETRRPWRPALAPGWRGALVHLKPGAAYEVEVLLADGALHCGVAQTRPHHPPIAHVLDIGAVTGAPPEPFDPADPTRLPADQAPAVIVAVDAGRLVARRADGVEIASSPAPTADAHALVTGGMVRGGGVNLRLDASYVVVRSLRLLDAQRHGVELGPRAHDVLIEDVEIAGFGRRKPHLPPGVKDPDYPGRIEGDPATWGPDMRMPQDFAQNWDSGVFAAVDASPFLERVTIRASHIHSPRYDACSWDEFCPELRPGVVNGVRRSWETLPLGHCQRGQHHPSGPRCHAQGAQAISLRGNPAGQIVIEDNLFDGSPDRFFNDGVGGQTGADWGGFPGPHADLARNRVSHYMDDGLELDNGVRNVRAWDNVIVASASRRGVFTGASGISGSPVAIGPLFLWRNRLLRDPDAGGGRMAGQAFKLQPGVDGPPPRRDGRIYLINNTVAGVDRDRAEWAWQISSSTPTPAIGLRNLRVWNNVFTRVSRTPILCRFCGGAAQDVAFARNWFHALPGAEPIAASEEGGAAATSPGPDNLRRLTSEPAPVIAGLGWAARPEIRGVGARVPNFADCHDPAQPGPDLGAVPAAP